MSLHDRVRTVRLALLYGDPLTALLDGMSERNGGELPGARVELLYVAALLEKLAERHPGDLSRMHMDLAVLSSHVGAILGAYDVEKEDDPKNEAAAAEAVAVSPRREVPVPQAGHLGIDEPEGDN